MTFVSPPMIDGEKVLTTITAGEHIHDSIQLYLLSYRSDDLVKRIEIKGKTIGIPGVVMHFASSSP
jgi:hypothetical protein